MSRREERGRPFTDIAIGRRDALKALGGGGAVVGAGKAVDNVLIGYGTLTGTNLLGQAESGALGALAARGLAPRPYGLALGDYHIDMRPRHGHVALDGPGGHEVFPLTPRGTADARAADAASGLDGVLAQIVSDLTAVEVGEPAFEFHRFDAFFDRVTDAHTRPFTVGALRGWPAADPDQVAEFADADPSEPRAMLRGLIGGFREHTSYDVLRYLAGSVEDNVIFGAVDLRSTFRNPVDFEALLADDGPGLFCYEFTHRSVEALHAVPAHVQSVPIVGARVWDKRHKHVYTAVATVVRDDGLRVPMTFVDYTHTTLYDDLRLRGILGEGFEAYNDRHRASVIHWRP